MWYSLRDMAYVLGTFPPTSAGASAYINYDGYTDSYFKSNSLPTPSPIGISLTYSYSNVLQTNYTATVAIQNTNSTDWPYNWVMTLPMDHGESIKSLTNCTATLVGRTLRVLKSGTATLAAGTTLTITMVLSTTTNYSSSRCVIIGFNGGIYRFLNNTYLNNTVAVIPEGSNNVSKVSLADVGLSTSAANTFVYVTFLYKSADFLNSIGYFTYPTGSPPTSLTQVTMYVLMPYVELSGHGGSLQIGTTFAIPYTCTLSGNIATPSSYAWPSGVSIAFFVNVNSWVINQDGTGTLTNGNNTWCSLSALNPGSEVHFAQLTANVETINTYTISYEDTPLVNADKDYNDGLFQVRVY